MNNEIQIKSGETFVPSPISAGIESAEKLGVWMAKSGMFGIQNVEQGKICALTCILEGMNPVEFARTYHIIKGKLTMRSDAMLGQFRRIGGNYKIIESTDKRAAIEFDWLGNKTLVEFTWEQAVQAKLVNKDVWRCYPAAMLFSRCSSKGVRMVCPESFAGVYEKEEITSIDAPDVKEPEVVKKKQESTVPRGEVYEADFVENMERVHDEEESPRKEALDKALENLVKPDYSKLPFDYYEYKKGTKFLDITTPFLKKLWAKINKDNNDGGDHQIISPNDKLPYLNAIKSAAEVRKRIREAEEARVKAAVVDAGFVEEKPEIVKTVNTKKEKASWKKYHDFQKTQTSDDAGRWVEGQPYALILPGKKNLDIKTEALSELQKYWQGMKKEKGIDKTEVQRHIDAIEEVLESV